MKFEGGLEIKKLDNVESIEAEIKMLQSKLEFYKELEKTKSPVEEAYKDWWGEYPGNEIWPNFDDTRWGGFQAGYNAAQKDYKVGEYQETEPSMTNCVITGNPPNGYSHWNDWYNELGSKGILHNLRISAVDYRPTSQKPDGINKVKEELNEWLKILREHSVEQSNKGVVSSVDKKPQTLYDVIEDWWSDIYTTGWDEETCIDTLVKRIGEWLPKPQSAAGSQNAYVECSVEGYNDCLNEIKGKLR
jgi:hypothetical protein